MTKVKCGDANPRGNVMMTYRGGCRGELEIEDAYRCTGCGGWFHKECIIKHFEMEKAHDFGKQKLREDLSAWIHEHVPMTKNIKKILRWIPKI